MINKNYYQLLEIKYTATSDEIKKAFRKKIKKIHPDINPNDNNYEHDKELKEIILAYKTLNNPILRKKYDFINNLITNNSNINEFKSEEFNTWLNDLFKESYKDSGNNINDSSNVNQEIDSILEEISAIRKDISKIIKR